MQAPEQTSSSSSSGGPPLRDSQDSDAEAMASGGASVRTITCVVVGDGTFYLFICSYNTLLFIFAFYCFIYCIIYLLLTDRHGTAAVGKTSLLTALTIKVPRWAVSRTRGCRVALNCGVCVASIEQDNSGMGRGEQGMEYHKKVPLIGNDGEV
jgi:hypothetical protein